MAILLSPVLNEQQFDANGNPLSGGKIHTYLAGTTTPVTTYKTSAGTAQANPIVLDSSGNFTTGTQLWLDSGKTYKFVVTDANDVTLRTIDNITPINDVNAAPDEWVQYTTSAFTYISATSFSVVGDQTGTFVQYRRLKTTNTGGTVYSTISTSSYSAGATTVTVANDSGTLDSGLSAVYYGVLSPSHSSLPNNYVSPSNLTQKLTPGTAVASTSGTAIDFTGIPSWAVRITLVLNGVSITGTNSVIVQGGTSGGMVASGYTGTVVQTSTTASTAALSSGIAGTLGLVAASVLSGHVVLTRLSSSSNTWVATSIFGGENSTYIFTSAGKYAFSAALDRVRVTTSGGDTFDAGSINIIYE